MSSDTGPLPLKARDAVDGATPAARATAASVGRDGRAAPSREGFVRDAPGPVAGSSIAR
ncbi:hypothetical protein GCM10009627_15860 [Curtobacterium herbarum]|uniref:Uncharacterized protein n=1 Tax=Curtobacterium herbarum TaxID=150122 RepID=A0ABN1ZCD0_9MICO